MSIITLHHTCHMCQDLMGFVPSGIAANILYHYTLDNLQMERITENEEKYIGDVKAFPATNVQRQMQIHTISYLVTDTIRLMNRMNAISRRWVMLGRVSRLCGKRKSV